MKNNILILDDDLVPLEEGTTEERMRLQPWLRWLKTGKQAENFNLIECNSLEDFINKLNNRPFSDPNDPEYIHALIIDIMWRKTAASAETFKLINYPEIKVRHLESGAQLLRLMFDAERKVPKCLLNHKTRPIAVLSNLNGLEIPLGELPKTVSILRKTTYETPETIGSIITLPNSEFQTWINNLTKNLH